MRVPSEGWSNLTRLQRGQSEHYNELASVYTNTSRRVGDIRLRLVTLAHMARIHPPITAGHTKISSERRPELEALGGAAIELLQQQDEAVTINYDAMLQLRSEDRRIYEATRINTTPNPTSTNQSLLD